MLDAGPKMLTVSLSLIAMLRAAHAGPTLAVTAFAGAMAWASGAPLLTCSLAVFTGQLAVGWLNDRVDFERDRSAGRQEKPLVAGTVRPSTLELGVAGAMVTSIALSLLAFGPSGGAAHVVAVISAQGYNLFFKSTLLSWLPYALSFALLPTAILYAAEQANPWRLAWVGGLLGVAAHLVNAIKDLDADRLTRVVGLPQRLGARLSTYLTVLMLTTVALLLFDNIWIKLATTFAALGLLLLPIRLLFPALIALVAGDLLLLLDSLRP